MERKSKQDVLIGERLSLHPQKKFIRTTCKLKCRNKADYLLNNIQRRAVKKADEDFFCVWDGVLRENCNVLSVYCIAEHFIISAPSIWLKIFFQINNNYVYTSNWKLILKNLFKNYDLLIVYVHFFFLPGSFWTISAAYFSARLALIPAARALLAIAPSNESSIHTN